MTVDIYPNRNRKPRWRAARRRELKAQGIIPANRQMVWTIVLTVVLLPEWAAKKRVKGLRDLWVDAAIGKRLLALDRRNGGQPSVTKAEFRRCDLCNRPLLGLEAAARRAIIETSATGRLAPCSPRCKDDLTMALWTKLSEVA